MAMQDINVGRATVTFGGVSLGETEGEVTVEMTTQRTMQSSDTYGTETPFNMIEVGHQIKVTVPLSEYSIETMQKILQSETTSEGRLRGGKVTGASMRPFAQRLIVHPIIKGSNLGGDIVIHQAIVSSETISVVFANDARNPIEVEFTGLLDPTNVNGVLYYVGTPL